MKAHALQGCFLPIRDMSADLQLGHDLGHIAVHDEGSLRIGPDFLPIDHHQMLASEGLENWAMPIC